ncbi:MAG TPA: Ig-like domain-containing protein [Rectinemataceae bacterium]|nr:Ig-like domain-containing protein [Rectinemataceae bacterium]
MGDLSAKRSAASAKRLSIIGLGLAIALSQTTCSAFNAGLGSKIDIEPPSVSILSPSSGDFVKGIITIKGKASDDTGVKSVVLALTNDQTQAAIGQPITANFDAKTGTWAAPLDVLSLVPSASSAEVPVSIVVTVTDIADPPHVTKTIPPLKLVFDDHAPTLALNYPDRSAMEAASNSSDHISLSGVVPFSGSAFDIGLKQVALTYTPYDSSGNRGASKTIVANGASSWSLDLDTTTLFPSSVGRVDLSFTATDSAYSDSDPNGNATTLDIDPKDSATSLYGVVIDQNASKPTFNSDNGNNLNLDLKAGLQPDPSAVYSLNPGITIPLTVEDINGLRTVDGQPYTWSGTSNLDVDVTVTQKMPQPDGSTVLGSAQSARTLGWLVPSSTIAPKTRVAPNGKTYVISADYRLSLPAATDGDFILGFTATNDHDAKAPVGNTDADETRLVDATITLDLVPPRATETNYGSALIQSNRDVSFAGIADDAAQTHYRKAKGAVLTYSKDGASPVTAAAATSASPSGFAWNLTNSAATAAQGFAWSYTLPASLGDGMYNLALAVTDYADKVSTVSRTVQIDTSAPVAVISNPQSLSSASSAYWLSGSTAGIGGTASDGGSGVAAVYYAAVAKGSAVPAFSTSSGIWTQAGGTLSWSGTLKLGGSGGLGEGEYTLYAAAVDGAGNVSPLVSRDFGVDLSQPNLAVTTPASDSSTYAAAGSDAFPGFAGNVWDSNALAGASSLTVYYTKNGVSAPVSTIAVVDSAHSAPGNSWTWTPFPSGIDATGHSNDGIYAFTFTATDVAGKTASVTRTVQIDTTAPSLVATAPVANESTSSSSYTIQGTSTDTGGVGFPGTNAVEYSLDGGSTWTGLSLSGTSWSATVSLGTTEGAKTLKLRSTDKLGNQSSQTIGFFYDLNPPVMQETGVGGGTNPATYSTATRSTVHFAGSASDTDALASAHALTVSIDHAAAVDLFGLAAPYTASGTAGGWTVNVAVGSGGLADGPHDFVFTATDIAGKTTSVERAVTVDTTAPVSSIVTPPILSSLDTSYWLSGATAGIGGTSTDSGSGASGIVGLYYDIVAKGSAAPAFSTSTWTQAAGTTNWNGTVKLSGTGGTGEGQFTMYVAAVDAVGNVETAKTRDFGVDQNPPTATETHTATFAAKSLYTLTGTIADTNSLSTLAITEQKGSGTPLTVAFAAPASVGGTSQGWTSASLPLGKSQADLDAHAADGSYAYAITVTDVAGKSTTITRTVNIDTTAPTLSMSAIPSWISSSAYTIGGSATDPNAGASGVANIVYSLDGGTSWTSAGWSDSSGGTNTSGTWTATLTGLAEGSHSLIVKAIDAAGNATTNVAVDFGVDLAAPSLGVGATPATITSSTASSFTGFGGTLSDSDPASVMGSTLGVTVSSTQNGNLVDNGSPITAGSNWTFGFAINATTHAQDGLWSFTFTATDVAGKATVVTRSLTVDTQAPTITVTSPSANGWVSSSSLSVTGVANDGSGTGVNAVYAKVDNASIDHSSEDPTVSANGWTLMAGKTNWNTDATHALPVLAGEGNKTLWIKATDAAGNITTASEAISATNKIDFGYDAAAPNLAETTINTTSTVSTDAPPSFDGATWDSDPVGAATPLTVSYSKNGGTATSATINVVGTSTSSPGNLWSWTPFATLDTAGHTQDGQWSFVFTATDAAGKTTVVTRSIQIDTTAPTAAVNAIGGYVSGVIPISGSSSDAGAATSGVAKVQYQLGSTAGAWTDASGAGSWIGSLDLSASAEGTLALYVRAVDFAGNVGLPVSTTINIDKANPEATETTHGTALIQSNMNVAFAGQADDAAVTSGRQASSAVLSYSKNGGAAVTLTGADGFNWNQSTGAWTYSLPTSLGDGLYALTLLVSDAAGKTASVTRTVQIDTTAPALVATAPVANESTSSSSYTIQGTSTDTGGVGFPGTNAVEYSLDGGSTWTGLSLSGTSWSATVSLGTTEGAKTLKLRSTDKLGNQSSQTIGFFYDLNPPVMQETGVGGGTNPATYSTATRGTIHFAGKVEDTDALAASGAFQVSIDHGAAVDVGSLGAGYAYATVATAQGFTWTLDVTVGAGGLADGTHDFAFTAKDIAGKTISVDRVEQVDTTAPSSAIVTPTAGLTSADAAYWLSGTTASINGTSGDTGSGATGVTGVYYKVVTKGSAAPTFSTASWTQAGGTSNWNGTLTLSGSGGIGEGEYALYVAAMDAVGNVETAKTRDFGVDQNPPTVTETHAAVSSTKMTYTLTGNIGDTNALATMSITESMNGGMAQAVGFTPSVALAGVKTASFTSASLPLGGVVDGSYAYVITGTDAAGKTTTVNRTITIDTTAPTVNLNAVPAWVSSSAYTISGSATDPNPGSGASGVATIQYSLDGGTSWANAAWTDTSGTNVAGTWTATMTALVEGPHSLLVKATDAAGNAVTNGAVNFGVDLAAPILSVGATSSTITAATASGFTSFTGTLSDTNPASVLGSTLNLTVSSTQNGNVVNNATPIAAASNWSFGFAINAMTHAQDGLWSFTFTATDAAGKTTVVTRSLTVDTEAPTITVTSPSANGWVSSSSLSVTGVASDGSGTGVSAVYAKVDGSYVASSGTDHSSEDPTVVGNGWTLLAGKTSWNTDATHALPALVGEGYKTLWVKAVDTAGNVTTASEAVSAANMIGFGMDLNPPTLAFTDAVPSLVKAGFTLAGTTSDSNPAGSPTLSVTIDGGAAQAVAVTSGAWTLPVVSPADGQHTYVFVSSDVAGKTTTQTRTITVDTTSPVTTINQPGSYAPANAGYWLSGATANLGGSASDSGLGASGVASVYYKVDGLYVASTSTDHGGENPTVASGWIVAAGTSTWSTTASLSTIGEGQHTLWAAALDNAGNVATIVHRDFGVDQNPPTVSETHAATFATKSLYTLGGTIADTNALAALTATEQKGVATPQSVTFTAPLSIGGTSQGWTSVSLPLGQSQANLDAHAADGSYTYIITVTDAAGKTTTVNRTITIDTTAPTVSLNAVPAWVSSSAYTISGSATDPNPTGGASGVATIQYSLDGGTTWANAAWTDTSGINVAGTWTATMTGLAEGPHSLLVKATDAAGNAVMNAAVNFGVDYNPPNLSVTAPPATVTATTAAGFAGMGGYVWDSYQLASSSSLTVTYTKNGGTATTATIPVTDSTHVTPGNAWTWTPFSGGIDAATHANDGIYSFTFTATDAAGKVTQSGPYSMTVDTMSPQLTVTSPATTTPMTWVSNSTLNVTGVANDGSGSGVQSVYVLVDAPYVVSTSTDHSADDPTATGSLWTKATGTVSFSASLTLASEGAKTLWIKAVDNYGNWTTNAEALSAKVDFGYDKTAPSLVSTDTVPSTVNAIFTLGGTISDAASGLASLVVSADGATPPTSVTFGSGKWSYPVASLPADGSHSYVFTATDNAGNVKTMTRTVAVDTKAPVVTFSNIDPTKNAASTAITLVDSLPKVMGTITDETGVGTVQSMVEFSADNGTTWTTTESWTSLSTSGSTPLSVGFAKDLSAAPFLTDGLYRIMLSVADTLATPNSGNSATVWFRLDRNNPVVSSLVSSAGSAAVNANFTLSGNASSNNLSVVEYRFDSGSYTTMSGVSPGTYSFSTGLGNAISVAASTMAEGTHTVTVQALSSGQRVGSQTYSFLVDKTAPAPTITTPASGTAISGNSVIIGGGATDLGGGGTPAGISGVDWQLARGMSLGLTGSTFSAGAAHGLAAGDIVYFSAYAGGSLPSGISANQPYWISLTGLTSTAFEVSATNGGAALNPGTGGIAFFAAKVGTWTAATYGSSTWNTTLDSTTLSEGSYLIFSRATDLAGNVSAAIASRVMVDQGLPSVDFSTTAASGIFSSAFVASGLTSDPSDASDPVATNGVASLILSIDDPTFNSSHIGTVAIDLTRTTAWSYDLASAPSAFFSGLSGVPTNFASISEGSHYLYARVTDKAGRTFDKAFAFIKDTVAPAPSFTNLSTSTPWTVYLQTGTKIAGTIADANGVASATYEVEQYTGGLWTIKQATTSLGSTANSTNFPWTVDLSGYADGHYRLTLNAQDRAAPSANAMAPQVCEFYLDTAAPTAGIANPATGRIASTDIGAPTGAAADANLTSAAIQLDSNPAVDVFASAGAWTYPSWNWAGLADGTHTLTLTATDIAGKTTTTTRTFVKDTSAPAVSYNNIATSGAGYPTVISTSATPSLSGTLTDASGIASYSYTLSAYNPASASWNPMIASSSTIVTGSPVTYNWSIPLSTLGLPDGKYQVTVSAIDVASPANGTASPTQVQFFISNASPAAALISPALGSWVSASFTLTGTAQDSSGVTGLSVVATSASSPTFGASNALPAFAIIGVGTATATFQTSLPHGLGVGDSVYIAGSAMPTTLAGALLSISTYTVASVGASSATSGIDEFTLTGVSSLTGSGSGLSVAKSGTAFGTAVAPPVASLALAAGTGVSTTSALFANGNVVYFTGSLPSATPAISAGTPYYVQSVSGSTFVLSTAASGGTILNYASAGSATVYSPSLNLGWLLPNISLGGVGNGAFTAYAQVTSADGKTSVASRSYSLDNQPPTVAMSSPSTTSILAAASPTGTAITVGASGSPLQGLVSIAGTTSDPGSGVSQNIQYYIGKTGSYQSGSSASNWVLSLGDISGYANSTNAYACDLNGQTLLALDYWLIPIHFQAVDNAGNSVQVVDYFVYNSNANTPTISISSPANAQTFGGQQRIYGTATQPVGVYSAEVYVDPTNGSTPPTTIPTSVLTSSTTFTLSSALASPLAANTVVYIKSVAQIPSLPGGATAGKAYYVVGATSTTTSFQVASSPGGGAIAFSSGVSTSYAVDQWAPATLMTSGTSVSWYYDINVGNVYPQSGQSAQTISVTGRAWSATSFGGPRGNFTGYLASPLTMTFNNTFPTVTITTITPQGGSAQSYTQSMDARGTFTLDGSVSTPVGLSSLNLVDTGPFSGTSNLYAVTTTSGTVTAIPLSSSGTSVNGYSYAVSAQNQLGSGAAVTYASGQAYKLLIVNPGSNTTPGSNPWVALGLGSTITPAIGMIFTVTAAGNVPTGAQAVESDASGKFQYSVAITINSSTVYPSLTTGGYFSGALGFNVQASDLTTPTAQVTTSPAGVSVDNFAPVAAAPTGLATVTDASSNVYGVLTGAAQTIASSVTDIGTSSGTVGGIKDIYVYLLDSSGKAVPLAGGVSVATGTYTYVDYQGNTQSWPSTSTAGYYLDIATTTSGAYVASGITGVTEMMGTSGSNTTWGIQLDTTKFADGPYTLAYTVFDIAGNATHFTYRVFVGNSGPKFSGVTLGTSIGGSTVTQAYTSSALPNTGFIAEGNTLSFNVSSVYGNGTTTPNGALSYKLTYGGTDYWAQGTVTGVSSNGATVTFNPTTVSPVIADTSTSNGASFVLTVTDQTATIPQSYSTTIAMNIQNADHGTPAIGVAPFGTQYLLPTTNPYTTGNVFQTGPVSSYGQNIGANGGHIDYTSPYTSGAAAVSGQVVFLGSAWNDQALTKITATIPGYNGGAEFNIATYSGGTWAPLSGTGWSVAIDTSHQVLGLSGQQVNWTFTWDSSSLSTVTGKNITVTFKAYNANPNVAQYSASSTSLVDVVPYVKSVTTALSSIYSSNPSAFNRSASGAYPVRQGETVTLNGYNLSTGSGSTMTLNGASVALATQSASAATFVVPAASTSGPLVLTVGSAASTNNANSNTAFITTSGGLTVYYDMQPNGLNSPNLTDDLSFLVWKFTTLFGSGTSNAIRYPTFDVSTDTTQRTGFAYDYGAQEVHVNDNGADTKIDGSFTQWYDTAFAYDSTPHFYAIGVNGDNGGNGTGSYNLWANTGFYAWQAGNATADGSGGTYTRGTYKKLIESAYNGTAGTSDRVQFPKIATSGAGNIYMTYYDAAQNQLTFRYGTSTGTTFTGAIGDQPNSGTGSYQYGQAMATSASTYGVGQYSSIGVTSGGIAVAAWYDQANQRLIFSYNTAPTLTTSAAQWQANATVIDSNFAGWYVDLAVDGNDGIHIAYYAAGSGDLKYAYLPNYSSASTVVTVDSFLSVGSNIGITTYYDGSKYVPYISYFMPSFTQALGSVRAAWRTNFAVLGDGAAGDQYTGNWEVSTVPSASVAQDYRIGIGMKKNASAVNSPILGYSTKNGSLYNLEEAQLQ